MKNWQEDLLSISENAKCENEVFEKIVEVANELGFDHCAYGAQLPLPLSNPTIITINNYPKEWCDRYASQGYVHIDPSVIKAKQSQEPIIWNNELFSSAPAFWEEARSFGLRIGWARSILDGGGRGGMLTLSRSHEGIIENELIAKEMKMRWLSNIAHFSVSKIFNRQLIIKSSTSLTGREIEVLKWTADGKTAIEISNLLSVSKNTIDFHIKNAITKLQTANKTAAVVKAAMLGLLY